MATAEQKAAARQNVRRAQAVSHRAAPRRKGQLRERDRNDLPDSAFAFPKERKEPLTDARHVRNAVARFDQVEGVTDSERDTAWKRIRAAARKFDVDIEVRGWRQLLEGGKAKTR